MENTLSIHVKSINETWEMPDDLALKLEEYKKEHPEDETDADNLHLNWFNTLDEEEKGKIQKHTPEE